MMPEGLKAVTSTKRLKIIVIPVEYENGLPTEDLFKFKNTPTIESITDILAIENNHEGLQYVALSKEKSSVVEFWDLKSAERFVQFPSNTPTNTSSLCNKDTCLFLV